MFQSPFLKKITCIVELVMKNENSSLTGKLLQMFIARPPYQSGDWQVNFSMVIIQDSRGAIIP
jgi:hypothetical protein